MLSRQGREGGKKRRRVRKTSKAKGKDGGTGPHWLLSAPEFLVFGVSYVTEGGLHILILFGLHMVVSLKFWPNFDAEWAYQGMG